MQPLMRTEDVAEVEMIKKQEALLSDEVGKQDKRCYDD